MLKTIKYITGIFLLLALVIVNVQVSSNSQNILGVEANINVQTAEAMLDVDCDPELGGVCETGWEWDLNECNDQTPGDPAEVYPCEN